MVKKGLSCLWAFESWNLREKPLEKPSRNPETSLETHLWVLDGIFNDKHWVNVHISNIIILKCSYDIFFGGVDSLDRWTSECLPLISYWEKHFGSKAACPHAKREGWLANAHCQLVLSTTGLLLRFCWDLSGGWTIFGIWVFFFRFSWDFDRHVLMLKCLGLLWFGQFLRFLLDLLSC